MRTSARTTCTCLVCTSVRWNARNTCHCSTAGRHCRCSQLGRAHTHTHTPSNMQTRCSDIFNRIASTKTIAGHDERNSSDARTHLSIQISEFVHDYYSDCCSGGRTTDRRTSSACSVRLRIEQQLNLPVSTHRASPSRLFIAKFFICSFHRSIVGSFNSPFRCY